MRVERVQKAKVISPAAEKSTLGWLRTRSSRSRLHASSPDGEILRDETGTALAAESSETQVTVGPHGDALPEGVD
jgi:hypothetical protein